MFQAFISKITAHFRRKGIVITDKRASIILITLMKNKMELFKIKAYFLGKLSLNFEKYK